MKEVEFECRKCHFFEPSVRKLKEGYCFVKCRRVEFDDACERFSEREGGGYFQTVNLKKDKERIVL